jgi:uncharacterized DUF497 family protein
MECEFDQVKAASNEAKHGVVFHYGLRAFVDLHNVVFDVSRSKDKEKRLKLVGSIDGLLFTVVYTMRGEITRLISVRRSNRVEEKVYGDSALHL